MAVENGVITVPTIADPGDPAAGYMGFFADSADDHAKVVFNGPVIFDLMPGGTPVGSAGASTDNGIVVWDGAGGTTVKDPTTDINCGNQRLTNVLSVSGPDDFWVGLGAAAGRLVFNSTPAPDQLQVTDADLCLMNGVEVRWYDVGSSNFIALEAPALTADATYILPATNVDGCLYNTSGALTWSIAKWVGTAFLGGDLTGNARGDGALDIQSARGAATQVASGDYAVALGMNSTASGFMATAVGSNGCIASANYATALGYRSQARIEYTTNICGPIINRNDSTGGEDAFYQFCGVEVVLMSFEVDLKTVDDQTITLPAGCKFWLNEVGLICTSLTALTTQPTVRYGITGNLAKHGAAALTTALTAVGKREIETPLVPEDGETSLTAGVTIAAVATTMLGRFYWKGMLVEDE